MVSEDALSQWGSPKTKRSTKPPADAPAEIGRMDLENSQNITVQHELVLPQLYYV